MATKLGYKLHSILHILSCILPIITDVHVRAAESEFQELCQTETFEAKCNRRNEVIFVKSALYGRMRVGRCVQTNYGHVGCSADVIEHTDRRCSGKRKCEIRIPDAAFDKTKSTCPVEFKLYFEVYYSCLEAALPKDGARQCEAEQFIRLTEPNGYLANVITEREGFGTLACPWNIEVQRGQRINITLYDFSTPAADIRPDMYQSKICYQYAIISETSSITTRNERICGGNVREKNVYTSRTNSVKIRIITRKNVESDKDFHFLFKYEAIGCPEPETPPNGWMLHNVDGVTMGCNHTGHTWRMVCEGTEWVGKAENCSAVAEVNSSGTMMLWGTIPYGVSVGIIGGLAAIAGFFVLLVALICAEWRKVKRSRRLEKARFTELQQRRDDVSSIRSGSAKGEHDEYHQQRTSTYISETGTLKPSTSDQNAKERDKDKDKERDKEKAKQEDDYMREMWPMAPPPGNLFDDTLFDSQIDEPEPMSPIFGCDSMELTQPEAFSPEEEFTQPHIYETPRPLRRNKLDPQYFEVDSKGTSTLPRNTLPARYKPAAVVGLDDDDDLMDNRRS